jgi:hypothetical protein
MDQTIAENKKTIQTKTREDKKAPQSIRKNTRKKYEF